MIYAIVALWILIIGTVVYTTFLAPRPAVSAQFNLTVTGNVASITHEGGDALPCDGIVLSVGGSEVPFPGGIACPWSIGETISLVLPRTGSPLSLAIGYRSAGGTRELFSAEIRPAVTAAEEVPVTPTPAPATPESPPVRTTVPRTPPTFIPVDTLGPPVASFDAVPRSGPVPLTVRFIDLSRGLPDEWLWTFGDGETSTEQNPVHTYTRVGTYQVGLTVRNSFGGHTRISQGFITVTPAEYRDVYLEAARDGHVVHGGFVEFVVTEAGSRVKIGGSTVALPAGSRVRLALPSGGKGKVSASGGKITAFSFGDTVLSIDGERRGQGEITDISVQGYGDLLSGIVLSVDGGEDEPRFIVSGEAKGVGGSPVTLASVRPDSRGNLALDCSRPGKILFWGAVSGYTLGEA
ncbi:MAG: PKD domain-containing protein [Methanolinea sp.]|nr:PKD domain-containing protein [Methanolinea sp.]